MEMDQQELASVSRRIRARIVAMSHAAKAPHVGSALSCVDILVAAYWGILRFTPDRPDNPNRDRLILSKGHGASALYAALAYRGFFSPDLLESYGKEGSPLGEHPTLNCVPGVEASTGSLGHGLPLAIGIALAARIRQQSFRTIVVMSDGECNEGSVWEAAMFAPAQKLDTVSVVVDFNGWQATGPSRTTMAIEPLTKKWEMFGWSTIEVDGHDTGALIGALRLAGETRDKPSAIIAHTVKGKGISFMENDNNWHYRIPTADEVDRAHRELDIS
jgi:transketolase